MESLGEKEDEWDSSDHVAGLAEQIAQAMLEDDDEENKQASFWSSPLQFQQMRKADTVPTYPRDSTTCPRDSKGVQGVRVFSSLPVLLQRKVESEAMELLYKELVRLKMEELAAAQQQLSHYQKPFYDTIQPPQFTSSEGLSQSMASSLMLMEHYRMLENSYNQQMHSRAVSGGDWAALSLNQQQTSERCNRPRLEAAGGYPYPGYPRSGSGMRAVFLGASTSRESGGTGVFLPRSRTGSQAFHSKRKPVCSTVLLPTHIVQALNLNVNDTLLGQANIPATNHTLRKGNPFKAPIRHGDALLAHKRIISEDGLSLHPPCSPLQEVAPDISLPTEWTY